MLLDPTQMNEKRGCDLSLDEVIEAMEMCYSGKVINLREQIPLKIRQGGIVLKVIVNKMQLLSESEQTYGSLS